MELDLAPAEREGKRPHYDSIDEDDYEIDVERWAAKKNQHETIQQKKDKNNGMVFLEQRMTYSR